MEQNTDIEKLRRWKKELDEVETFAISSPPISEADLTKRLNSLKNNTYLQDHLEVVQRSKQKTLLKLAKLEEMEEALKDLIAQQQ